MLIGYIFELKASDVLRKKLECWIQEVLRSCGESSNYLYKLYVQEVLPSFEELPKYLSNLEVRIYIVNCDRML